MQSLRCAAWLVVFAACAAVTARAQGPVGADTLSAAAVADSQAALRAIDQHLRSNANDAAAWHRRGMVAWALAERGRSPNPPRGLDPLRLSHLADTSLRRAAQMAPSNVKYRLTVGRFLLASNNSVARTAAVGFVNAALDLARASKDSALIAETALEAGRIYWRRYDGLAHRVEQDSADSPDECRYPGGYLWRSADIDTLDLGTEMTFRRFHNAFVTCTYPVPGLGEIEILQAEPLFREAHAASPTNERAFRQLAMVFAERRQWRDLETIARARVARIRNDVWGQLALGLALQRSGQSPGAGVAFAAALARLDAREREQLFGLHRVLASADAAAYIAATPAARAERERLYWLNADPLWGQPGGDPRTEFIARVVYAELRWTVEEMGVRGADSDRGMVYARYGPPDVIGVMGPAPHRGRALGFAPPSGRETGRDVTGLSDTLGNGLPAVNVTFWDYNSGYFFIFEGMPSYATASFNRRYARIAANAIEDFPSSWVNVAEGTIVRMPVQTARFRATGDSVDVYIASQGPVSAIRESAASNTPVRMDVWLFDREVVDGYRDSTVLSASGVHAWAFRVPRATYISRLETTASDVLVAGLAMSRVVAADDSGSGFSVRGQGISDVLFAGALRARTATPARWIDFSITPLLGAVRNGSTVELLWENYDFGAREGQATYTAEVVVERSRGAAGRIAAEIISRIAGAIGVDRRDDRVTLRIERAVLHAAVLVDQISVGLGTTPPGDYRITLRITDRVTGHASTRSTNLVIVP